MRRLEAKPELKHWFPDWSEGAEKPQSEVIRTAADARAAAEGYLYNPHTVDSVCSWFEKWCIHTQGRWAGTPFVVSDWQRENILGPIYGWVTPEGRRRCQYSVTFAPKKTPGKSFLAACMALFETWRESGAEVLSGGGDKQQAGVVHGVATDIVMLGPLDGYFTATPSWNKIVYEADRSEYRSVANRSPLHGPNVSAAIFDEVHEWKDTSGKGGQPASALWDKLRMAQAARLDPLYFVISNSGESTDEFWFRLYERAKDIQEGRDETLEWHGVVCEATEDEAVAELDQLAAGGKSIEVFKRVNPQWNILYDSEEKVITELCDMWRDPKEHRNCTRFRYSAKPKGRGRDWLGPYWNDCHELFEPKDFYGCTVFAGMDKGHSKDLTAIVLGARRDDHVYIWPYYWLTKHRAKYLATFESRWAEWAQNDNVYLFPGNSFHLEQFKENVRDIFDQFDVAKIIYDNNKASLATQFMDPEEGEALVGERLTFGQSQASYNQYTTHFEDEVYEHRVKHTGCPVLSWQAENAIRNENRFGYVMPTKSDPNDWRTVDGIQAAVMLVAGLYTFDETMDYSHYEDNEVEFV